MEAFLGEVRMFAGDYAPEGWAICDGRSLPVRENQALFSIIGNKYGGDPMRTFDLPDLRDRLPVQPMHREQVGLRSPKANAVVGTIGSVQIMDEGAKPIECAPIPPTLTLNFIICTHGGDYPVRADS